MCLIFCTAGLGVGGLPRKCSVTHSVARLVMRDDISFIVRLRTAPCAPKPEEIYPLEDDMVSPRHLRTPVQLDEHVKIVTCNAHHVESFHTQIHTRSWETGLQIASYDHTSTHNEQTHCHSSRHPNGRGKQFTVPSHRTEITISHIVPTNRHNNFHVITTNLTMFPP